MKRIISIILCVAMLMSMVAVSVSAYGEESGTITTSNNMSFTTDKESYKPGDTVTITAKLDSIWGDPDIEGDVPSQEGYSLPGAYGMKEFNTTLIFPKETFTVGDAVSL